MVAPTHPSAGFPVFEILEPRLLLADVSGHITADTVWNDTAEPYRLVGDLYVDYGATLTLGSGVTLGANWCNWLWVDGRLEGAGAIIDGRNRLYTEVRARGVLDLDGGTVRADTPVWVRTGGQADLTNVTFAEGTTVTYDVESSGVVDNGQGRWNLSVASTAVSVVNGIDVDSLTVSAPVTVAGGTIDVLTVSASATVTGSTIGYMTGSGGAHLEFEAE